MGAKKLSNFSYYESCEQFAPSSFDFKNSNVVILMAIGISSLIIFTYILNASEKFVEFCVIERF